MLPPALHRAVCSCWPGITFSFPIHSTGWLHAACRTAEILIREFGTIALSLLAEKDTTGLGAQAAQSRRTAAAAPPARLQVQDRMYRKPEPQPNKTRASVQLPELRRDRGRQPGVSGVMVHIPACKGIWRPQVGSGWAQDKFCSHQHVLEQLRAAMSP